MYCSECGYELDDKLHVSDDGQLDFPFCPICLDMVDGVEDPAGAILKRLNNSFDYLDIDLEQRRVAAVAERRLDECKSNNSMTCPNCKKPLEQLLDPERLTLLNEWMCERCKWPDNRYNLLTHFKNKNTFEEKCR